MLVIALLLRVWHVQRLSKIFKHLLDNHLPDLLNVFLLLLFDLSFKSSLLQLFLGHELLPVLKVLVTNALDIDLEVVQLQNGMLVLGKLKIKHEHCLKQVVDTYDKLLPFNAHSVEFYAETLSLYEQLPRYLPLDKLREHVSGFLEFDTTLVEHWRLRGLL
jgi:hypothetical protein